MDFRPLVRLWVGNRSLVEAALELGVSDESLRRYRLGLREPSATLVKTMEARYPEWQSNTNGAGEAVAIAPEEVRA